MFLRQCGRYPPTFDTAGLQYLAQTFNFALLLKFVVNLAGGVQPELGQDIRLTIFGDGGNCRYGV